LSNIPFPFLSWFVYILSLSFPVESTNTVPVIALAFFNSNFNEVAASVSSSYVSICPGTIFPGTESLSNTATGAFSL